MTDDAIAALDSALEIVTARLDGDRIPVGVEAWEIDGEPPAIGAALRDAEFSPVQVGDPWGLQWGTTWFRFRGTVPAHWAGRPVELSVDLGYTPWPPGFQAEALLVTPEGGAVRGLHPRQQRVRLRESAVAGEQVEAVIEAAANPPGGVGYFDERVYTLTRAELVTPDGTARALAHDLDVLRTLLVVRGLSGVGEERVREVAEACARACALVHDGQLEAARAAVGPVLAVPAGESAPQLRLVGHAHLDTAWLWPIRETVRKAVRSYANVLALMDEHDGLTFAGTQALHHEWVRDLQPGLWGRLRARADQGRWVPVGGMWVESDTLLASGESLARQFVHGQRWFAEHLGREARVGWLPDCFGYAPVLPQLLRQAGIGAFLTQKLSWNDTNRFPHTTFWWEGLDGSQVLCHFPTVDTYNTELHADDVARVLRSGADSLAPFGYGDGGGGPTEQMLERAARMRDLDGLPRTEHASPDDFFAGLDTDQPVWRGDLYLETHRGVWTSQRETKLGDARCDEALAQAELWCATAAARGLMQYPHEALDALWKRHLVLEFHDILPGSSIGRVHREAEAEHAEILAETLVLRDEACAVLGGGERPAAAAPVAPVGTVLDNGILRAHIDHAGRVGSLVDLRTGRELAAPGDPIGQLRLHPDHPAAFDAWNLDRSYREAREDVIAAAVDPVEGGVRATVEAEGSRFAWTWSLPPGEARLDLALDVDWHASARVLKLALPVDLRSPWVTAGVQWGQLQRPVHANTSWEEARYEDWFHGHLHVDEGGLGMAAVTADAHGYDVSAIVREGGGTTTTTLGLTLLRAPGYPDPDCDRGRHAMRVSLLVGVGVEAASLAGYAARAALVPGARDVGLTPLAEVRGRGVRATAVKLADDGSGDVVVRLHEFLGGRAEAELHVAADVARVVDCDLLERPLPVQRAGTDPTRVLLRPFESRTLRVSAQG